MFTVKALRVDADGKERLHLYEAHSVDVLRDAEGLNKGESYVIFKTPDGEQPAITVTNLDYPDGYPCRKVFIENSDGRTTEVVRAFNNLKNT